MKEGYRGWGYVLGMMKHVTGLKRDCALEYANWYGSGFQGAFIAREGYYSTQPENVKKFLSQAEWDYWYDGKPAAEEMKDPFGKPAVKAGEVRDGGSFLQRMGNIAVWNSVMDEDRYLTRNGTNSSPRKLRGRSMQLGVFIPIGNNGWLISTTSPQYMPSFDLNRTIVEKAERFGFDFALSMIKLRGFGGPSGVLGLQPGIASR